jgi:hypothetical protein
MRLDALFFARGLILLQTSFTGIAWILSWLNSFDATGFRLAVLLACLSAAPWLIKAFFRYAPKVNGRALVKYPLRLIRYPSLKRLLPLWFFLFALLALWAGYFYPPTLYDALTYRLPRALAWSMDHHWFWISTPNERQNYSAPGFEFLTAPSLVGLRTDRLIFLPNMIAFFLMPGLLFSAGRAFGIPAKLSWIGMWFLPLGYCFVCQAASIGNDHYGAFLALATLALVGRLKSNLSVQNAFWPILAAALLTNIKATNAILAPCLLAPLAGKFLRLLLARPFPLCAVTLLGLAVSFLPTAFLNHRYAGHWSGVLESNLKVSDPAAGLVGNLIQVTQDNLAPPVFPPAKAANRWLQQEIEPSALIQWVRSGFPRMSLGFRELLQEEGAGIGPFHFLFFLFALIFALVRFVRLGALPAAGLLILGLSSLAAMLTLFTQLGTEATARILAPFYPGFFLAGLGWISACGPRGRHRLIVWTTLAAISVLPLSILNPSRPKLPTSWILSAVERVPGLSAATIDRIRLVYVVYQTRNDVFSPLRRQIPDEATVIGLFNNGDDNETSLWRPYGSRRVISVAENFVEISRLPRAQAWVARRWVADRLNQDGAWVQAWREAGTYSIAMKAAVGPEVWVLYLPR